MLAAVICLATLCCLLTLGLGIVVGYLVRQYIHDTTPQYSHPEMFDANGNPLPDEIIAFRFENSEYLDEFEE
jgi:hypothetical protein